jgi:putative SOS response-associated peptidase YedK
MLADVYPDREGLVIHMDCGEPVVDAMRWVFPPPPNPGSHYVTNVRNTKSAFWKPWLKVEHRCVVPVAQFAEPDPEKPKPRRAVVCTIRRRADVLRRDLADLGW